MLPRIRHERILRELQVRGEIRSSELAVKLGVDNVTIRRDIAELAAAGLLARVHGGALATEKMQRRGGGSRPMVGVIVPSTVSYFPEVVRGMDHMAAGRGVRLVVAVSSYDNAIEKACVDRLLALGVSGLILAPTVSGDASAARWLGSLPVPTILLERMVDGIDCGHQFESVRTDHNHGCALAVRHLEQCGHRRIRVVVYDRTTIAPWLRRGIGEATERFGLEPAPIHVVPKGDEDPDALTAALRTVVQECGRSGTTAVIAHTDYHASRLVEVADSMGVAVPEDLAIIAYDDELAELAQVPLTAVTAPRREVGRTALALMLERLDPTSSIAAVRHVELLPSLTVRQSTVSRDDHTQVPAS